MADNTEGGHDAPITFKVKASGEKNHTITMNSAATVADLKIKLAGADFESIPLERQRLIYSGRVMKNDDTLGSYKIKAGNTIHLVKSAASNPTPAPSSAAQEPVPRAIPNNMAAGTSADNQLEAMTGARYAGHLNLNLPGLGSAFGADGGMGAPPSEEMMADMLENDPAVAQQLQQALSDPNTIDMMIRMDPRLRDMPGAREMFSSPMFRQMLTNPGMIREAARMRRHMGVGGGPAAFPAPGATDTTPADAPAAGAQGGANNQENPFAALGGLGGGAANNPFAALLTPPAGQAPAAGGGAGGAAANPFAGITPEMLQQAAMMFGRGGAQPGQGGTGEGAAANPLAGLTPEMMQQMMAGFGGAGTGGEGFAPGWLAPPPAAPADTRPPEERYADQLQQLNEMGFYDFDQNVAALRRSGGNVQGAVNFLLGG